MENTFKKIFNSPFIYSSGKLENTTETRHQGYTCKNYATLDNNVCLKIMSNYSSWFKNPKSENVQILPDVQKLPDAIQVLLHSNSNCVQQNIYPSVNECENNLLVSNFVIVQSDCQMHKWSKNKQNIFKCVIMIYCG